MKPGLFKRILVFLFSILLSSVAYLANAQVRLSSTPFSLGEILPQNFINSANYRINILGVRNDLYHFLVESELGDYEIDSVAMLIKRLREINTIIQVSNQINQDVQSFRQINGNQITIQTDKLIAPIKSNTRARSPSITDDSPQVVSEQGSISDYLLEHNLGHSPDPIHNLHKRNVANQLGMDVYTRNFQAQLFLDRLARSRSGGNISAGARLVKPLDDGQYKISSGELDRKINSVIRKFPLEELELQQRVLMSNMSIDVALQKAFLGNKNLSPSIKTSVVYYLNFLGHVEGISEPIAIAAIVDNPISAEGFLQLIKMLVSYHERIAQIGKLQSRGTMLSAITKDKRQLFFHSHDLFNLNEPNRALIQRITEAPDNEEYKRREMIFYGDVDQQARYELLENNIDYREYFLRRL